MSHAKGPQQKTRIFAKYLYEHCLTFTRVHNKRREYRTLTIASTYMLLKVHSVNCRVFSFYINTYRETKDLMINSWVLTALYFCMWVLILYRWCEEVKQTRNTEINLTLSCSWQHNYGAFQLSESIAGTKTSWWAHCVVPHTIFQGWFAQIPLVVLEIVWRCPSLQHCQATSGLYHATELAAIVASQTADGVFCCLWFVYR